MQQVLVLAVLARTTRGAGLRSRVNATLSGRNTTELGCPGNTPNCGCGWIGPNHEKCNYDDGSECHCRCCCQYQAGACKWEDPFTSVAADLNSRMATGNQGTYSGGKGVLFRNLLDGYYDSGADVSVVPGTFLTNDIKSPSTAYPNGNPECPNNGNSGYNTFKACPYNPWDNAVVGIVVGTGMPQLMYKFDEIQDPTWGWGVFYGTDSNSVDQRCAWSAQTNSYDCPGGSVPKGGSFKPDSTKKGAGYFPAGNPTVNPDWGGGAGCHFAQYSPNGIDQIDAIANGANLGDDYCQCNYDLGHSGPGKWAAWVDQWIKHSTPKKAYPWQSWLGGNGKAPSFALDSSACWVNNPRDMFDLQNAVWERRNDWSNQMVPTSNWGNDAPSQRLYWGWNEVPLNIKDIHNPLNWDTFAIKLPAAIDGGNGSNDGMKFLSQDAQNQLEADLYKHEQMGALKPGWGNVAQRPGSYVLFLKEQQNSDGSWSRFFFCEEWVGMKYHIKYLPQNQQNGNGACWIEYK